MHPVLSNRDKLRLYLAAWIPIAGVITALLARGGMLSWMEAAAVAFPMCAAYAFMCGSTWYLCRVTPLTEANLARVVATFGFASVLTSGIWLLAAQAWVLLLDSFSIFPGLNNRYTGQTDGLFLAGVLLFFLAAAVHYLLLALEESRLAEKRALELQVLAREAELKTLRAQINPHFLFNSLNSISALTSQDASGARRMCLLLADFLRRSLQLGAKEKISFGDELKLAESFLDIEKVRFGEITSKLRMITLRTGRKGSSTSSNRLSLKWNRHWITSDSFESTARTSSMWIVSPGLSFMPKTATPPSSATVRGFPSPGRVIPASARCCKFCTLEPCPK